MIGIPTGDEGQASTELALVTPFVALLLLAVIQVASVVRDQVLVVHAAREAAREGAVSAATDAPRSRALSSSGLDPERLGVEVDRGDQAGSRVRVKLRYRAPTEVPLIGPLLPEPTLGAEATMRVEG